MTNNRTTKVQSTQQEPERKRSILTFKATQLVWLFFGILEVMIALRIGLKLMGANSDSLIAVFIYGFTDLFLFPFVGLVKTPVMGSMVLEISSVIAMLVYALIAWGIERIIWALFYRPRGPVVVVTHTTTTDHHTP